MDFEQRATLADELCSKVIDALSPQLLAGTGEQLKERREELLRIAAKVMGAVLYDELSDSEQMFRTRSLQTKIMRKIEQSGHVWLASSANDEERDN